MKKVTKRLMGVFLLATMIFSNCLTAFASTEESGGNGENSQIIVDMDSIDITKPYEISKQYIDDDGNTVTVGAVYKPNPDYQVMPHGKWSESHDATVGTWTSYYDGGIACSMSYDFDVERSESHWKISNGRNFSAHAILSTIDSKKLVINRSVSTATFPAEIVGSCTINLMDTQNGSVATIDAWIKTTVNDSGTLTVSGN